MRSILFRQIMAGSSFISATTKKRSSFRRFGSGFLAANTKTTWSTLAINTCSRSLRRLREPATGRVRDSVLCRSSTVAMVPVLSLLRVMVTQSPTAVKSVFCLSFFIRPGNCDTTTPCCWVFTQKKPLCAFTTRPLISSVFSRTTSTHPTKREVQLLPRR